MRKQMKKTPGKNMSIDDLAIMVARRFDDISDNMVTKDEIKKFETRVTKLEESVQQLLNKLSHYIDLHEERYLDLKYKYKILSQWARKVSLKTGIPLDIIEEI